MYLELWVVAIYLVLLLGLWAGVMALVVDRYRLVRKLRSAEGRIGSVLRRINEVCNAR